MDRLVTLFDLVALFASSSALFILCLGRKRAPFRGTWSLFFVILVLTILHDGSNFLEWAGITAILDPAVDRVEILTVVLWGFLFYIFVQRLTERDLRRSEERYRRLFEAGSDMIIAFEVGEDNLPGRIVEVNEIAGSRLGYGKEEFLKMAFKDLNDPGSPWDMHSILISREGGHAPVFEGVFRTKEGSKIPVEINSCFFELSGKQVVLFISRDITERIEQERLLREVRELDAKILDSSPVSYLVGDREGRISRVSRAFKTVSGLDPEAVVGKTPEDFMPEGEQLDALKERIRRVLEKGVAVGPTETPMPTSKPGWVRETILPLFNPDGIVTNTLSVLENITVEVETQKSLQEITQLDEKILFASPVAFVLHDEQKRIIKVSRAYQEVSGYPPEQVMGKTLEEFMPEGPQRAKILENIQKAMDSGEQVGPQEIESTIPGLFLKETVIPVFGQDGRVVNILSVLENITERKKEADQRKKSEEKYRMLFETIQEGVALQGVVDDGGPGNFIQANPAFHRLFGYDTEELCSLSPMDISHDVTEGEGGERESKIRDLCGIYLERGFFTKTGRELICEMRTDLADIGGEKFFVSIFHDVTQRVHAERMIRSSLREKEVLLKEIHHRVKNNLQVISGLLNLQSYFIDDPGVKAIYRDGQNRIQAMSMIHEELYQREDLSFISIHHYLRDLSQTLLASYLMEKDQIRLLLDLEEVDVVLDTAVPCGLIVNELISNSLKHAFPGGRRGAIQVHFTRSGSNRFTLSVSDDGVGLPPDFDPACARSMGIQLVRILSEQLGGELKFFSEGGSSFRVEFNEYGEG
ncbi:MAG: PAS domain S-box protein [Proteobacteria bacterium]|nr:PAS domain S-box protein [Pseudomonadota bacterium]